MQVIESNGRWYPEFRLNKNGRFLEPCIFCNQRHTHGLENGHRVPHCNEVINEQVTRDGYIFQQQHGYYVKVPPKGTRTLAKK